MGIFEELGAELIKRNLKDKLLYGSQTFSCEEDSLASFIERNIHSLKTFIEERDESQCPNKEGKYRMNIEIFECN